MSKFRLGFIACWGLIFVSCSTPKNVAYFQDVPDTLRQKMVELAIYYTPVIQPDDILQVSVQTLDPTTTALLNQQNNTGWSTPAANTQSNAGSTGTAVVPGYLVDKEGYVVLPLIGRIMAKGKTTGQIRDEIRNKAAEFYKDPVVAVRFANFKITVLGEVARPSTYIMPNERVTLLDAIGAAGDLTIYGKRENVMLIRENNGKKEFVRFNLNNSNLFSSPYFYLQQGDVVYVEPNKAKVASTDMAQVRRLSVLATALSVLIVLASRIQF
ncbi:polysaccharide biosynthesis/export family protein [Chitinophaga japonensis]|uniref:Polysaccharide export outer membrane protein n=1 Tax=Chitinophaga japonensis TaxID=104662 RepID=A0A562T093_CHIJA|nr:polysaccharide biosynthesis/export family protein [Chitinophaga japonensis]TWI86941.1 polysaccharide export outer membrane protein [Chitinophaga japonensis]